MRILFQRVNIAELLTRHLALPKPSKLFVITLSAPHAQCALVVEVDYLSERVADYFLHESETWDKICA